MIRDGAGQDESRMRLSAIESGIAACMVDGMTDKEAALALGRHYRTVERARWDMAKRLGFRNPRAMLIEFVRMDERGEA